MQLFSPLTQPGALKLIDQVETPFRQLPHLPAGVSRFLANLSPWVAVLVGLLSLFSVIALTPLILGSSAMMSTLSVMVENTPYVIDSLNPAYYLLSATLLFLDGLLLLAAFQPLRRKELRGWALVFWSNVVSSIHMIVGIAFAGEPILSSLLGIVIGFYIVFETKKWFTPTGKIVGTVQEFVDKLRS
jgi:hypothetical protein